MYADENEILWTWDHAKADENIRKHDVDFEMATLVFRDRLALTYEDPFLEESRWRTIGMVNGLILIVIHTLPEYDGEPRPRNGRIISARKAERHERRAYEERHV